MYLDQVESEVNRYLGTVTPEELSRKMERRFTDGTRVQVTVEDMLIHIFQEEPPHLGWVRFINM
ncbi:MAG: hypothetical protein P1P89_19995 [Desulfobacterales bacterium]|nr:hypothetical protein [Desulfobacterales bacterium]